MKTVVVCRYHFGILQGQIWRTNKEVLDISPITKPAQQFCKYSVDLDKLLDIEYHEDIQYAVTWNDLT